jgi:hypothetical protein
LNISFEQAYTGLEKEITYTKVVEIDMKTRHLKEAQDSIKAEVPA